jgi:hypothetical protein
MNLKRQMKHDLTVYAHILNSALGVEERNQNWAAFHKKWSAETDLQLAETDDIQKADFIFLATGGWNIFTRVISWPVAPFHPQFMHRKVLMPLLR